MSRKPEDEYAVLAVAPEKLEKRIRDRLGSVRKAADLCGHASHSHLWRLTKGEIRTTSPRTADVLEALLDAKGLLFARMSARSDNQDAA
jgi:hypothetical protein